MADYNGQQGSQQHPGSIAQSSQPQMMSRFMNSQGYPPRQVPMGMAQQPPPQSQFQIVRPTQSNQTPPNNQQDGGGQQMYQHRASRPSPQQIQMMQSQQKTPPNQQQQGHYNNSSPYTPPQHPSTPNYQPSPYSNQQQHQYAGPQQQIQRSQTPQQHSQSPIPQRKNTSNDGMPQDQHYIVQTSAPISVYQPQDYNNAVVVSQPGSGNFQIRHPVTHRPLRFANQITQGNPPMVRYSYPPQQGNPPQQSFIIQPIQQHPPQRMIIRPGTSGEYRPQYVQIVKSEPDGYRNGQQTYTSQPNVYYRPTTPQQPTSAIRQALAYDNSGYRQPMQTQVLIQHIDQTGQPMFRMPASIQRQTSSGTPDSSGYEQGNVPSVVESTVAEFAAEYSGDNSDFSQSSPSKRPKPPIKTASKQVKKMIKRPFEDSQIIPSSYHGPTKTVITEDLLEQAAHSVNQSVILEEDVKQGIIMYMEEFVDKLVAETGRATNLRKSKQIQAKDVDYALRFNVNAATNSTSGSVRFNK